MRDDLLIHLEELFNSAVNEVPRLSAENIIVITLLFYITFVLSRKIESASFRFFTIAVSIFLIFDTTSTKFFTNIDIIIALGLLIPHIGSVFRGILNILLAIKIMFSNTYFFFISIVYKLIRFFRWIKSIYENIRIFFESKKEKTKEESNSFNSNSSYEEPRYEEKSYSYKEEKHYSHNNYYEEQKESEQKEETNNNYSYENNYSSNESSYEYDFKSNYEYAQFYSENPYIVLGVSESDDFKFIKKQYRLLTKIYHPDLNTHNIEMYTEITQNINNAYDVLKRKYS